MGEFDKARDALKDFLNASARGNVAVKLLEANIDSNTGDFEAAANTLIRVLEEEPTYFNAWNNIYYCLSALMRQDFDITPMLSRLRTLSEGTHEEIHYRTLHIKIRQLSRDALGLWEGYCNSFKNTCVDVSHADVVSLRHFGRSGSGLFHTLLDNHSRISSLPSIFLSEFFDQDQVRIIEDLSASNIADYFVATYPLLFDCSKKGRVRTKSGRFMYNLAETEGLTTLGPDRNACLQVDSGRFKSKLIEYLNAQSVFQQGLSFWDT